MKNLFNPEGVFVQFLSRVGDLILLNVLFLACCLPVVTIGASTAALHKVTQDYILDNDSGVFKPFFRAFAANFKQATVVWLVQLFVIVGLGADFLLITAYFTGTLATVMYTLLIVLMVLVACVSAYMTPLLVRYENTLRQHLSNAVVLAIIKLPKTVGMVVLNLLPLLIALLSLNVFLQTMVFWISIGFAFVAFLQSNLLKSVFGELEQGNESVTVFK